MTADACMLEIRLRSGPMADLSAWPAATSLALIRPFETASSLLAGAGERSCMASIADAGERSCMTSMVQMDNGNADLESKNSCAHVAYMAPSERLHKSARQNIRHDANPPRRDGACAGEGATARALAAVSGFWLKNVHRPLNNHQPNIYLFSFSARTIHELCLRQGALHTAGRPNTNAISDASPRTDAAEQTSGVGQARHRRLTRYTLTGTSSRSAIAFSAFRQFMTAIS